MELAELMTELRTKLEHGFNDDKPVSQKDIEQLKADAYNAGRGDLDLIDGYGCNVCKNKGYIAEVHYNEMFDYYAEALVPCKCQKSRRAISRLNRSGLKDIVNGYTFEKYETGEEWQKVIKNAAIEFCNDKENNCFFIGGQSGAGKTHICTAMAVRYIKLGNEVKYMLWRDEISKIKAVVNDPDVYGGMIGELKRADVLYIDDLFKSGKGDDGRYKPPTAADINVAFEIINYRYNNRGLVTIISSERTLSDIYDIDEAIAGRIAERSKAAGYCINLKPDRNRNWRMKGLTEI